LYRHILVPTDGSLLSARAAKAAVGLGKKFKARITAVHVVPPYSPQALSEIGAVAPAPLSREQYRQVAEKRGSAALKKVTARAGRAGLRSEALLVTDDDPGAALIRAAQNAGCDLIVMGSSSRAGIQRIFLGSVASEVLNGTRIPTLICR